MKCQTTLILRECKEWWRQKVQWMWKSAFLQKKLKHGFPCIFAIACSLINDLLISWDVGNVYE